MEERKAAITLEWPLSIQFVLQTRAKFHLRTAPPEPQLASGPPRATNYFMDQAAACPVLLLLNLVGHLWWESENTSSALAPPTSVPPPDTPRLQLPDPVSLGGLCGNPGFGKRFRNSKPLGPPGNPPGRAAPAGNP